MHFTRMVSDAVTPAAALTVLADVAQSQLHADGVAVLGVTEEGGVRLVEARGLPQALHGWESDAEVLGDDTGDRLMAVCEGRFRQAVALPLVNSGDLYGQLVLFFMKPPSWDAATQSLADGLVDMAAIAMAKGMQILAMARSNAELRASREVLARSEKLRALGQMAAGVSHDLKNILNPLLMQVQLLRRKSMRGEDLTQVLERMERVVHRGVETVERLRAFSRQSPEGIVRQADLNDLVREATEICAPRLRLLEDKGLMLREELGQPPKVMVQPSEVVTALVNLMANALDAMIPQQKGELLVRTGAERGGAWVEVADTGPGIPKELEPRVFEPFFTTKGEEGTGLGLSMLYAMMQRHGGTITLNNRPGAGASFTLWFPGPTSPCG